MPNNKKKKKGRNRSEAAVSCASCSRKLTKRKEESVQCVCTRVLFCNDACRVAAISSNKHACPGPPEQVVDLEERLRASRVDSPWAGRDDRPSGPRWTEEHQRTVLEPMKAFIIAEASRTGSSPELTPDQYAAYADRGSAACAYMAGVSYKNRMLGPVRAEYGGNMISDNTGREQPSVLSTDELAFKYFSQAAEAGIGFAMQSLADMYENGQGVRKSMLRCREWLWRATLQKSVGAQYSLDTKSVVPCEIRAQQDMTMHGMERLLPGQQMNLSGPNITSLLLLLWEDLERGNCMLPAFNAATPALAAGSPPHQGLTGPVKIVGSDDIHQFARLVMECQRRGNRISCTYGRRGTAKSATALTYTEDSRGLDCDSFVVPPNPACDERLNGDDAKQQAALFSSYLPTGVHCVHAADNSSIVACKDCISTGLERLSAVSSGSVVLSLQEHLQARGRTAIWRTPEGTLKSETFKNYGPGEVESLLAALATYRKGLAYPLFVSQDPNFFWPLIHAHGCIRAALEHVAPHLDWTQKLGPVKSPPTRITVVNDKEDAPLRPGTVLIKCGNDLCLNVEPDRSSTGKFLRCTCDRRFYCSKDCWKVDWIIHKRECTGKGPKESAADGERESEVYTIPSPVVGEKVIVHSLMAKPELNGCVGVVCGDVTDGRYPVKLQNYPSTIGVKPDNLYQLNIYSSGGEQRKKAQKFRCYVHRRETCTECSIDFCVLNHLSRVQWKNGSPLNQDAIERASETQFATMPWKESEMTYEPGFPVECQALQDEEKRFVLKALLDDEGETTVLSAAAIAGLTCFGARTKSFIRPQAVVHLVNALAMI